MQPDSNSDHASQKNTQAQSEITNPRTSTADGSRRRLFTGGFSRRSFLGRAGVLTATATGVAAGVMSPLVSSKTRGNVAQAHNAQNAQNVAAGGKSSQVLQQVLSANQRYVETFGDKANLTIPPARRFAVLTCMDARLDPAKFAGLAEGDAHVIRNAGGRVSDDAIRSLVISYKLLGTKEWFVIHHTNCGMEFFTDDIIRNLLANSLTTAVLNSDGTFTDVGPAGTGSTEGDYINWLTIANQEESVARDVRRIRFHPLVPDEIPIYGYIYDVKTGKLNEVPKATQIGRATGRGTA